MLLLLPELLERLAMQCACTCLLLHSQSPACNGAHPIGTRFVDVIRSLDDPYRTLSNFDVVARQRASHCTRVERTRLEVQ